MCAAIRKKDKLCSGFHACVTATVAPNGHIVGKADLTNRNCFGQAASWVFVLYDEHQNVLFLSKAQTKHISGCELWATTSETTSDVINQTFPEKLGPRVAGVEVIIFRHEHDISKQIDIILEDARKKKEKLDPLLEWLEDRL
jgi:hypothetical protein